MEKKIIHTDKAPAAIGPYSQACVHGELIFTAGQVSLRPDGSLEDGSIEAQTRQALDNLKAILEAAGSSLPQVLKATVFLTDLGDFGKVNEIYGQYFDQTPPARSCVQVSALPKGVGVEIEVIAVKG